MADVHPRLIDTRYVCDGHNHCRDSALGSDEIKGHMPVTDADITIDFQRLRNSQVNVTLELDTPCAAASWFYPAAGS